MLQVHQDRAQGQSAPGAVDPSVDIAFLPSPGPGRVRVPLYASIQSDGPEPFVTCHGILRRVSAGGSGWLTHPDTCLLWTVKLTPVALVGGEFFVPVPLIPIPEGWEIIASWSYATGAHELRTRAVSVDVPASGFNWAQAWPQAMQPRLTTV